jgi:hypothetical protein
MSNTPFEAANNNVTGVIDMIGRSFNRTENDIASALDC